jgi:hypothetical protein
VINRTVNLIHGQPTKSYLENNQSPVARKAEINFHTVLFVSFALELFGLTFLIFKLIFVSLFRIIERRILFCSQKKLYDSMKLVFKIIFCFCPFVLILLI